MHINAIHKGQRNYKCDACEKSFTHPASLKRHKIIHEGQSYNDTAIRSDFENSTGDNLNIVDSAENNIAISENIEEVHQPNNQFPSTSFTENEIIHEEKIIKPENHLSTNQIFVCPICGLEGIYRSLQKAHQHISEFHQLPLEKQIALGVFPQERTLF